MRRIFLNSIFIFLLTLLLSFLSKFLTFPVLRIFLPTTHTLFSNLKVCFSACILFSLFQRENNKYQKGLIRGVILILFLSLFTFPMMFYSISFYLLIFLLFFSIFLTEMIVSKMKKASNKSKYISITLILILFYLFLYFTDKPLDLFFFLSLD